MVFGATAPYPDDLGIEVDYLGKIVDEEVFNKYGRNTMSLTRTEKTEYDEVSGKMLRVWYADFGTHR